MTDELVRYIISSTPAAFRYSTIVISYFHASKLEQELKFRAKQSQNLPNFQELETKCDRPLQKVQEQFLLCRYPMQQSVPNLTKEVLR